MDNVQVTINGKTKEYPSGTSLLDVAKDNSRDFDGDILLAYLDGKLSELNNVLTKNHTVSFLTGKSAIGNETYKRSVTLMMLRSFYKVCGKGGIDEIRVEFSLSRGYFCTYKGKIPLTRELLDRVYENMKETVAEDIPVKKRSVPTNEALRIFREYHMYEKEKLFKFRRGSAANIYSIGGYEDYYYGYMVPSTGYLKKFALYLYDDGFVLQFPGKENPDIVPEFLPQNKLYKVLRETESWSRTMSVNDIGSLNECIAGGNINDMILVQEALQEKKIADIAQKIAEGEGIKFVMIAGPSSSGKTTFSHRLSIQLRAHGMKPHPIAVDNYFIDRQNSPRDEHGNYNFEVLEALDVERFNEDMLALSAGREVELPEYNFITGKREYNGNKLKLEEDGILIIEGIHCLNDRLSHSLDKKNKFKIYISALSTLNIDEHNRIPTTDGRLLRRMVRDARTRGTNAAETIGRWESVRHGEENYIFPFQDDADVVFNSALIYELAVLKPYAEPLLFDIPVDSPSYTEAKRLLKFLDYIIGMNSENIPKNSLVREFIGGSCFKA